MDPQHRRLLETSYRAFENGGLFDLLMILKWAILNQAQLVFPWKQFSAPQPRFIRAVSLMTTE